MLVWHIALSSGQRDRIADMRIHPLSRRGVHSASSICLLCFLFDHSNGHLKAARALHNSNAAILKPIIIHFTSRCVMITRVPPPPLACFMNRCTNVHHQTQQHQRHQTATQHHHQAGASSCIIKSTPFHCATAWPADDERTTTTTTTNGTDEWTDDLHGH